MLCDIRTSTEFKSSETLSTCSRGFHIFRAILKPNIKMLRFPAIVSEIELLQGADTNGAKNV